MPIYLIFKIWKLSHVWSLSSFEVSYQILMNDLNQVLPVPLLMTSSRALANEGLFVLTRCPSLTQAVSFSLKLDNSNLKLDSDHT